jgi:predicted DNA-binding transcriptional regulator AlpA
VALICSPYAARADPDWHTSKKPSITSYSGLVAEGFSRTGAVSAKHRLSCLARDLLVRTPPPPEKVDLSPLPMTKHQPELISVRDAIEELRISRTTFYKLKNQADFPQPNFLPRRTLFRRSEIWAWLENRRR